METVIIGRKAAAGAGEITVCRTLFQRKERRKIMVVTYMFEIGQLDDDAFFQKCLGEVSAERQKKVHRARKREDQNRILGAGLLLAHGLAEYGICEQDTVFQYGENGKPYLADMPQIHFNLSHSGDYAAAAFSSREVGIDIECERKNGRKIAARFFAEEEIRNMQYCKSKEEEDQLFLRYWTLKESFLKVTGYGMALPLNAFRFELQDTVKVIWEAATEEYYFQEFEMYGPADIVADREADGTDMYRIAVCALEDEFAPEPIWIKN